MNEAAAVAMPAARDSHPWRLTAAILVSCIGAEVFIIQPGFVQGLVQSLGFDEKQAGYAASIEVWGITATTLLMTFFSHRFNWRTVSMLSLLVMALTNAACIAVHDQTLFLVLRFLCGAGAGSLISLGFTVVGLTDRPDRNFGYLIMWVLLYGAIALYVMPSMFAWNGMTGVLAFLTVFPLVALPLVRAMPVNGEAAAQAGEHLHLVALDGHAPAAPVAGLAPLEVAVDRLLVDEQPVGQAVEDRDHGGAVRLPGGAEVEATHSGPSDRPRSTPGG